MENKNKLITEFGIECFIIECNRTFAQNIMSFYSYNLLESIEKICGE